LNDANRIWVSGSWKILSMVDKHISYVINLPESHFWAQPLQLKKRIM
jgi:hypothetical protein